MVISCYIYIITIRNWMVTSWLYLGWTSVGSNPHDGPEAPPAKRPRAVNPAMAMLGCPAGAFHHRTMKVFSQRNATLCWSHTCKWKQKITCFSLMFIWKNMTYPYISRRNGSFHGFIIPQAYHGIPWGSSQALRLGWEAARDDWAGMTICASVIWWKMMGGWEKMGKKVCFVQHKTI